MRKRLTATITALALAITCFAVPVSAASGDNLISRVGDKNRTVKVGNEFELKVKKGSALSENDIKWTSSNTSVVKYDDDDRYDNEMEFKAVKKGKATITAKNLETGGKIYYYVTVKEKNQSIYISRVGEASRTVSPGAEFELKVKKGDALKNSQIKWTIGNTNIVAFDDDDRYGNDIELKAKKAGTTKVTANNLKTGGKIVYTITVKSTLGKYQIGRVGNVTKYVECDDDIELKVRKGSALKNSQIKWTVSNKSLLKFEDGDNYGKEVELEARGKTGTVKVTAHNLHTGGKIVYTVKITADND